MPTMQEETRWTAALAAALTVVALGFAPAPARAEPYPQKGKSVQMLVGFAAGGTTDVGARLLASALEKELGTNVVVVNKPGASSQLAYTLLSQSKPDGYTIGNTNFPSSVVSYLDPARQAAYKRKDFQLIGLHVIDPTIFAVKPDSPFKTLKDLVEYAKANPRKVRITTTGIQSDETFAILQLEKLTGAKFALVHFAQGVAQALPAFLGNKVEVLCANVGDLLAQHKRGEVRILGVMDSQPSPFYADVKTFEAQGYKIYAASSRGFAAPGGTPKDIVDRLAAAMKKVADSPEHQQKMAELGLTLRYMDPAQYNQYWTEYEATLRELLPLTKELKD
jgi:tripartite-type tricarboxylate transporter receptor subunit TctC